MTRQIQVQHSLQKVMQHANDIWNRVLFSLELMEYALGERAFPDHYDLNKILLDLPDGDLRQSAVAAFQITDLGERDSFIQLQVRAFRRGIRNSETDASEEMPWLMCDFLEWYAGRRYNAWSKVDEYSLAIVKALLVKEFNEVTAAMPEMHDDDDSTHDLNASVQIMGTAAHLVDGREQFVEQGMTNDEENLVEKFNHTRGSKEEGFFTLSRLWLCEESMFSPEEVKEILAEVVSHQSNLDFSPIN